MNRATGVSRAIARAVVLCAITTTVRGGAHFDGGDGPLRASAKFTPGLRGKPMGPAQLVELARSNRRQRQTHPGKRGRA